MWLVSLVYQTCYENFGPKNFSLQDQNFQQKYWSAGPFFENFCTSEKFGPIDLMVKN